MNEIIASVIVINFNGKEFLKKSLKSLHEQSFDLDKFEIIVVDNGSTDDSVEFIKNNYEKVSIIVNEKNLGFAPANNLAFQKAKGKYFILLNNDTYPENDWLCNLVNTAERLDEVGVISGKNVFYYDQLVVNIKSPTFKTEQDSRELGVMLFSVDTKAWMGNYQYLDGFYGSEKFGDESYRWTNGNAFIGIPINPELDPSTITLEINPHRETPEEDNFVRLIPVQIYIEGQILFDGELPINERSKISLAIPGDIINRRKPVIQNAGSLINKNGFGRDRGTIVKNSMAIYESDNGQYENLQEVFAACGANMLIKKKVYEQIGGFEEKFFAYYEDTEYSWRCWLNGWKVIYEPKAIIRHIHCGTSKEWSPLFIFLTERNRLATLIKLGEWGSIVKNLLAYIIMVLRSVFYILYKKILKNENIVEETTITKIRLRVIASLLTWLPRLFYFRIGNIKKFLKNKEIIHSLYSNFN